MVFWYCKWCPLNYLITLGCGAGREGWCPETPQHTLYGLPYHPLFSHPPSILLLK